LRPAHSQDLGRHLDQYDRALQVGNCRQLPLATTQLAQSAACSDCGDCSALSACLPCGVPPRPYYGIIIMPCGGSTKAILQNNSTRTSLTSSSNTHLVALGVLSALCIAPVCFMLCNRDTGPRAATLQVPTIPPTPPSATSWLFLPTPL
jgi:hypothetical protein